MMRTTRRLAAVLLCSLVPAGAASAAAPADPVGVQLLSITDLHGYFFDDTMSIVGARTGDPRQTVGGGSYLTTHIDRLRAGHGNSILFSAGDDFSGWPDATEWFWNEPTIEYLNSIGLDFSTVGNHELDRGVPFLRHMIDGTCQGRPDDDLCFDDSTGHPFRGADFPYYSANVIDQRTGRPALPPYHVELVDDGRGGKLPIGFVHASTKLLSSEQMSYTPKGYDFTDEADAINRYAAILRARGVRAIVAVIHEGFSQKTGAGYNECVEPFGPVVEMNQRISPDVDAIVSGHWHAYVNCMLPDPAGAPRPVVEAGNHGALISEIALQLDRRSGEVLRDRTTSVHHANTRDVPPDPATQRLAAHWQERLVQRANTPVARIKGDLLRAPGDAAESTLGNVTADAFLWAANRDGYADVAVAMPGILRRDLPYGADATNPADRPGRVLFSEVAVGTVYDSGIGVGIVRGTVTGRELDALLESQWQVAADGTETYRHLSVSRNLRYRYRPAAPVGQRIDLADVRLDGRTVRPGRRYRVATLANNFFAKNSTPGFTALLGADRQDRSAFNGGDALWRYLEARSPLTPPALGRSRPIGR